MKRKTKTRTLKVVFDTSALYTDLASELVRKQIKELIANNSSHSDLEILWFLPDVVVGEREYQMRRRARELVPSVRKLERLLGNNLNVTDDILDLRVREAVERGLAQNRLHELQLDTSTVAWPDLVKAAVTRQPPFDPGEQEKGFRDALIAQAFRQLADASPRTPESCRLVLVTDDELLKEHVDALMASASNVRVISDLSELEGLINTLVSTVTEDYVARLAPKAFRLFFERGNEASLFFKDGLTQRIEQQFSKELAEVPPGLSATKVKWAISQPAFKKKDGQRIYWTTDIKVHLAVVRVVPAERGVLPLFSNSAIGNTAPSNALMGSGALPGGPLSSGALSSGPLSLTTVTGGVLSGQPFANTRAEPMSTFYPGPDSRTVTAGAGVITIEVEWSASVSPAEKLTKPKTEALRHSSTAWDLL